MTAAFATRLDDEMLATLAALVADTDRSRRWIAAKAIESYVEPNGWQIAKIKEGIARADRGDFATEEELDSIEAELQSRADVAR